MMKENWNIIIVVITLLIVLILNFEKSKMVDNIPNPFPTIVDCQK